MIILASTSPTRQSMLRQAGVSFTAVAPDVSEDVLIALHPGWSPEQASLRLAEEKAIEVSTRFPNACVIGADQVLANGTGIYGKPNSVDQCRQYLRDLRGKTHELISSVASARSGVIQWFHTSKAQLRMRAFSESFLESYLEQVGKDCMSSAGGYKIEGLGVQLFEDINGDHFTILGLPLIPLLEHLRLTGEIRR